MPDNSVTLSWSPNKVPFSVVDVETTGVSARFNRITEIGIITFCGEEIVNMYNSFINPGCSIPREITRITGITDADVADAPSFDEVAHEIYAQLEGTVLVGHNLAFDYQFLRAEFLRSGIQEFSPMQICTLRLARRLYPQLKSKSLGNVAHHLRIFVERAHRALDDADITLKIFKKQIDELKSLEFKTLKQIYTFQFSATANNLKKMSINKEDKSIYSQIPDSPGVYLFLDAKGKVIYIGKGKSLKKRLQSHFASSAPKKSKSITERGRKLQLYTTNSELVALLLEAELIKLFMPKSNVQLKKYGPAYFLKVNVSSEIPAIEISSKFAYDGNDYFGLFINRVKANDTFELIQKTFRIRECADSVLKKGVRCYLADIDRCTAPCENGNAELQLKELEAVYDFLFGKQQTALNQLVQKMKRYSDMLKFEKASETKEVIDLILKQVHRSSLLAEPVNKANVLIKITGASGDLDFILLNEGRAVIKDYPMDDRSNFEQLIEEYYAGLIHSDVAPEKEDLEKMKIILNWVINNRNSCEFYYLKSYHSKEQLLAAIPSGKNDHKEKILNIEVESFL